MGYPEKKYFYALFSRNNKGEYSVFFIVLLTFLIGMFIGILITNADDNGFQNLNGTFVLNGTDEYYYLQYMDYNKKDLIKFYDLQQVIGGNFCKGESTYLTDITPQSFRLQCCYNFTSCENFVVVNKRVKEIEIR